MKCLNCLLVSHEYISDIQVTIARRFNLFPFRTEKLSVVTPMVLRKWESRSSPFSDPRFPLWMPGIFLVVPSRSDLPGITC